MSKRTRFRTEHDAPEVVAAALRPDNTDEMSTRVVEGAVVTTIQRETTGGLRTTADDYVCNLQVADRITNELLAVDDVERDAGVDEGADGDGNTDDDIDTDTHTQP